MTHPPFRRHVLRRAALLVVSAALLPSAALSQGWTPGGKLVRAVSTGEEFVWRSMIARDGASGVFAAHGGVARIDPGGQVVANWDYASGDYTVGLEEDGAGGFFDWYGKLYRSEGIRVMRRRGDAAPLPGWNAPRVVTSEPISDLVTEAAGPLGAFAAWRSEAGHLHLRRVGLDGTQMPVSQSLRLGNFAMDLELASDRDQGLFVAWTEWEADLTWTVRAQRVDAGVNPMWGTGGHVIAAGSMLCDVATDGAGGAFIAWRERVSYSETVLRLLRLTADGLAAPGWPASGIEITREPHNGFTARLTPDGAGGVYLARSAASDRGLHVRRFDANGATPAGVPAAGIRVGTEHLVSDGLEAIASGPQGLYVLYTSDLEPMVPPCDLPPGPISMPIVITGNLVTRVVRVLPELALAPGWDPEGEPLMTGELVSRSLVSDDNGGAYVLWMGMDWFPVPHQQGGAYVQRVTADGPVAGTAWFRRAELEAVQPRDPRILLEVGGTPGLLIEVLRQRNEETPVVIARLTIPDDGRAGWADDGLETASRYRYWIQAPASRVLDSVQRTTPEVFDRVELAAPWPNPTTGSFSFTIVLPQPGGAHARLFDVHGREAWAKRIDSGAGRHHVSLKVDRGVQEGLYWLRVEQPGQSSVARRVVLIR